MSQYSVLAARLRNELTMLDTVVKSAQSQAGKGLVTAEEKIWSFAGR